MTTRRRGCRLLFAVAVAAWTVIAVHAQPRRAMTLIDLMEVPRVVDPQLSPDGHLVVYQLNRADWKAGRRVGHLWIQPVGGGPAMQLTFGDSGEFSPRWSPDGKSILFMARRNGGTETQAFLLPAEGGEPRALTHHGTSVSSPAWAPDGSAVYFIAPEAKTADEKERDRVKDDVFAFEENAKQRHLWKVIVSTGAEMRLTSGETSVLGYRPSRDGRRIALHRAPTPLVADAWRGEIWLMDPNGENIQVLTRDSLEESEAELSPDGSSVLFLAEANAQLEPDYSSTLFVMPSAPGSTPKLLLPDFPYAIDHATWSPDGKSILAVVNMGVHSEIFAIDPGGRSATPLTDGRHSVQFWSLSPSAGRMVFQYDEPARFGDVWTLDVPGDGRPVRETRVTGVYDFLDRDYLLPRQEKVEWRGTNGTTIEGLLSYPLDYAPGKRYPLVVQLHGGPAESDKFGAGPGLVNDYVQVLTAKGYAVLKPNYRGSAGYGNAFLRDVMGGYFRNMHLDVLAGVDALVKQKLADPDRLVVMGWSAGGHLTNKLITYTDRFKAASSGAGAANWVSMYAQTDTRSGRTGWFGGTPWQKDAPVDLYWNASPLKYAGSVRTPTLFFVGENDGRVPMPQSVEMYRALRANGVASRLYVAPREGHQWVELRHQLYKMNAELEWFERYAMGRAYVWELAPGESKPHTN